MIRKQSNLVAQVEKVSAFWMENQTSQNISLSQILIRAKGFPGGLDGKESACNADLGSIPWSGRSPGEGKGNPLQYSCLENSMDKGLWWVTVHGGHKESDMIEPLTL